LPEAMAACKLDPTNHDKNHFVNALNMKTMATSWQNPQFFSLLKFSKSLSNPNVRLPSFCGLRQESAVIAGYNARFPSETGRITEKAARLQQLLANTSYLK
ncbi:hypothetical protein HAX54_041314, partial [Datura stramonium]|nr:hypothetical protein [Datura stramonium]